MKRIIATGLLVSLLLVSCSKPADKPAEAVPTAPQTAIEAPGPESSEVVGLNPGNLPYDFTMSGYQGQTYKLADFKGKPTLLIFWTSS